MCYYQGGKKRVGKQIAEMILNTSTTKKLYVEPFSGMLGVFRHLENSFDKKLLADRNPALIQFWRAVKDGWSPPTKCEKKKYEEMKASKDELTPHSIFCGYAMSQRGSLFSTFCPKANLKNQRQQVLDLAPLLKNVDFRTGNYWKTSSGVEGAVIYCDPPYRGTGNKYQINRIHNKTFDYDKFWNWCLEMAKKNEVYVSEYANLPQPGKLIWASGKEKLYKI